MAPIQAQKTGTVTLLPVSGSELSFFKNKYSFISIGEYDLKHTDFTDTHTVGYLAGDIDFLITGQGQGDTVKDVWFINNDFFNKNYKQVDNIETEEKGDLMSYSNALRALKEGLLVARKGWNGKNMFIFIVPGSTFEVNRPPLLGIFDEGTEINYHAHIDMRTADGTIVPWLASQTDILANDWKVIVRK